MTQAPDFEDIRSYYDSEYRSQLTRLLTDREFIDTVDGMFGNLKRRFLFFKAQRTNNADELQRKIFTRLIGRLVAGQGSELTCDFSSIPSVSGGWLFISNHRDIVLDSAILDILLIGNGGTGAEIAIGDNLLAKPWIERLVRINHSFIVKRSVESPSEFLKVSGTLSAYIRSIITENGRPVWLAQREGRAKDSNDLTQKSLLKMLALSGAGEADSLKELHIVPLAISYEYDPCDWLKAMEFQLKRDNPDYRKTRENDLLNMKTGIMGYKGRIHYQSAPCIDGSIGDIGMSGTRNSRLEKIAGLIDAGIHANYRIYGSNFIAYDMLNGGDVMKPHYSSEERRKFEEYLNSRIALIQIPNPDIPFLRGKLLEMYANPLINHLLATR